MLLPEGYYFLHGCSWSLVLVRVLCGRVVKSGLVASLECGSHVNWALPPARWLAGFPNLRGEGNLVPRSGDALVRHVDWCVNKEPLSEQKGGLIGVA